MRSSQNFMLGTKSAFARLALLPIALSLVIGISAANHTAAQEVSPCTWQLDVNALVEPWEQNTISSQTHRLRLALVTERASEPTSLYVLVIHFPKKENGFRDCKAIGLDEETGFSDVDLNLASIVEKSSINQLATIPVKTPSTQNREWESLEVIIDSESGSIAAHLR